MKVIKSLALGVLLAMSCAPAWAEEGNTVEKAPSSQVEKYDFTYVMGKNMPTDIFVGELSVKEMEERLHGDAPDSLLYLRFSEEKVLSFKDIAGDRSSCRQILYASPNETMLQFYTNDKKAAHDMYRTLRAYNDEWSLVDGCRVVSDKSPEMKLPNKKAIYKFWFKKVKPDNRAIRVVGAIPYPYPYDYYNAFPLHFLWGPRFYHHPWRGHRPPPHRR